MATPVLGQRSLDELGTPLRDATFVVVDLETTGSNRNHDEITEIGAIKVRGGEVLGTFHTLVNPGRAIPPQITVLTGLTDAVVTTAPPVAAILAPLRRFLADAIFVAHNAAFDLGFLRACFERHDYERYHPTVVDTAQLARRVLRDEVPNCKLGTLADRLRLDHRPTHRALDDAKATVDLLHFLIERASGLGVGGLDDLVTLTSLAGHAQAGKLGLTATLPRSPGVYLFRGARDEVLYVGKATNLRQRVRSYFGREDRRRIGPMLREMQRIDHVQLADPVTAEVVETRLIARLLPRYNRVGTRVEKYCYVRLDTDSAWPRLSIVKNPATRGVHLGPLSSRKTATLVIEALQSAIPIRRCTARLGRTFTPPPEATACSAAQLGVAMCPCAGQADPHEYQRAVDATAQALRGHIDSVVVGLADKMTRLAIAQRFEEAAAIRDRIVALTGAVRRQRLIDALRAAGRVEIRRGAGRWVIEHARLVDVGVDGALTPALPVSAADPVIDVSVPLPRAAIDEAMCLAKFIDKHAPRIEVLTCSGVWNFPVPGDLRPTRIDLETLDAA